MVEGDDEIKVLGEVNVELKSGTHKLKEKLSQEKDSQKEALREFNSTLENVLQKLSQEKDSPDDFYSFMYDTYDDVSISDQAVQDVVVQNNVQQEVAGEVVFNPLVHEEVAEEVMEMAIDQDEAQSDQEVADDSLDHKHVEERRPSKRIRVTQEEMVKDEKP
ncbi:hypothetical protein Tco_0578858 [Tanacetum coccineum]